MQLGKGSSAWWGPPKKFNPQFKERKISWLELFYDLVYVIAISRITHHLSSHISLSGFFEYACLFVLVFWGWLNGSLYHDLHGNAGLRTRLMTLWQMMIIAALTITIDQQTGTVYKNTTVAFMVMQLYITYQWWSVGFYDREHRKYNMPYTILYLTAFALMGISLALPHVHIKWIVPLIILFNYSPPFIANRLLHRSSLDLNLSSSMSERLGLFTIIVLGEVVLGVVNGVSKVSILNFSAWLNFGLSLSIVFALWWLFFTLTSDRDTKKGFVNASLLEMLYLPTLMSLGLIAACLSYLFQTGDEVHSLKAVFGYSLTVYLAGIGLMMGLLEYPDAVKPIKGRVRVSLFVTAFVFLVSTLIIPGLDTVSWLFVVIGILIAEILYLNSLYYALNIEEGSIKENTPFETE
jgi:low temperature requirement protein LtrA